MALNVSKTTHPCLRSGTHAAFGASPQHPSARRQRSAASSAPAPPSSRSAPLRPKTLLPFEKAASPSALATFSQFCSNIELLNLKYCKKISDRTSQCLSLHCHKLQYLDVSSCAALTDISMHALSQGCPSLVHLDISWCDMITSTGIKSLADGCKKLQNFIAKGKKCSCF